MLVVVKARIGRGLPLSACRMSPQTPSRLLEVETLQGVTE